MRESTRMIGKAKATAGLLVLRACCGPADDGDLEDAPSSCAVGLHSCTRATIELKARADRLRSIATDDKLEARGNTKTCRLCRHDKYRQHAS